MTEEHNATLIALEQMIPKIIHYCWFGKGLMPKSQKDCIKGWQKLMPDYKIMRWDESSFDLNKHPLAKYACEVRKFALASDVCRYNVLTEYGGIYLDTDVEVFRRFDDFLHYNFFSGIELYNEFKTEHIEDIYLNPDGTAKDPSNDVPRLEILTSSMGCCPGHEMIRDIRDYYESMPASAEYALNYRQYVNNDRLVARYLSRYGFRYKDVTQEFGDGMVVFGTGVFGHAFCPNSTYTVSYHHNAATWEQERWTRTQKVGFFFDKLGLLPVYKKYKALKKKIKKRLRSPVQGEIWCLHRVVPERSVFPSNRELEITPDYLVGLIENYKSKRWKFVDIDTILNKSTFFGSKRVNISFDDGFKDVYSYAFPILKRYGIPFTIYLSSGFPEGTADIWWMQLEQLVAGDVEKFEAIMKSAYDSDRPMADVMHELTGSGIDLSLTKDLALSWEQLKEMAESGLCTIGSHALSHPGLTRLPENKVVSEIMDSKTVIEQRLSVSVKHFSYPHSMYDDSVISVIKDCGIASAAVGYGGRIRRGDNCYILNRKHIVQQ